MVVVIGDLRGHAPGDLVPLGQQLPEHRPHHACHHRDGGRHRVRDLQRRDRPVHRRGGAGRAFLAAIFLPEYGTIPSVAAALAFGAGVGFVNGIVTVRFRSASFVVTLGMLGILQGFALRITGVISVPISDKAFLDIFGNGYVGPLSVQLIWTAVFVGVGHVVLAWTPAGRATLATGANPNAARFSGIRTERSRSAS